VAACARSGRSVDAVTLVAVTKSVDVETCRALLALGVTAMGENRVDIAGPKVAALGNAVAWHMIGNVQRRKAREVVGLFDVVDAVDRVELAEALERRLEGGERRLPILLEVNISGEASKHGLAPGDLSAALKAVTAYPHLDVRGLMTMAPFEADDAAIRGYFRQLKSLTVERGLPECSMGMTNDFEIAIEEGATQVRVGSALFE
jgi:pyridoxal phosphate enzyme (YggS family)